MLVLIMAVVILALISLGVMSIAAVVANAAKAGTSAYDGGAGASDARSSLPLLSQPDTKRRADRLAAP